MVYSKILKDLEAAYNSTFDFGRGKYPFFRESEIVHNAFDRVLEEAFRASGLADPKYCLTSKNKVNSWATFVCPCQINEEDGSYFVPNGSEERKGKVTVLLHWAMNFNFVDDMTSWGHEKCSYKIEDVDCSVIGLFLEDYETNYFNLYDAIVRYKETGEWILETA
jgi:hypothetical protein